MGVKGAARRLRRPTPAPVVASGFALTPAQALDLLFSPPVAAQVAPSLAGRSEPICSIGDLRSLLSGVDRQIAPSPVHINFGAADVIEREVDGLRLFLDASDVAVSRPLIDTGVYEAHLSALVKANVKPGMTMIDVGANIGYYASLSSRLVGERGRVIAIEPNSENCRLIALNVMANGLDNVTLIPVACDAGAGWAYFSSHLGSNGGLIPSARDDLLDGRGTVVPTFALDDLVTSPVHFIKMDIEGAEGRALQGATRILEDDRPIVTSEVSFEMIGRVSQMSPEAYLSLFIDRRYEGFVIDRHDGHLVPIGAIDQFVADWGNPLRIEDLVFVPR